MKFGHMFMQRMTNIFRTFLPLSWKLETDFRPFNDFDKITVQREPVNL